LGERSDHQKEEGEGEEADSQKGLTGKARLATAVLKLEADEVAETEPEPGLEVEGRPSLDDVEELAIEVAEGQVCFARSCRDTAAGCTGSSSRCFPSRRLG
jgi:hypothetical protein